MPSDINAAFTPEHAPETRHMVEAYLRGMKKRGRENLTEDDVLRLGKILEAADCEPSALAAVVATPTERIVSPIGLPKTRNSSNGNGNGEAAQA